MTFRRILTGLSVAVLATGCSMSGPGGPPRISQPTGVEGEWVGTDGVAVSSFNGGEFRSTATDTGQLLATGSYRYVSQDLIEVTINSIIRQTTSKANCAVVSRRQLNCTSATGAQFTLVRRA
ncbi:MAG: hypothetical protein R3D45_16205 [Rhizobiaceae bacterium]